MSSVARATTPIPAQCLGGGPGQVFGPDSGNSAGAHGADHCSIHDGQRKAGLRVVEDGHPVGARHIPFDRILRIAGDPLDAGHLDVAADER